MLFTGEDTAIVYTLTYSWFKDAAAEGYYAPSCEPGMIWDAYTHDNS